MRIAFSTLGCPGVDLDGVLDLAVTHGFAGVELRAAADEPVHVGLGGPEREAVARRLSAAGITAVSVAGYVKICDPDVDDRTVVDAGVAQVRLAHDIGARYLRVFPGGRRDRPVTPEADRRGARRLARILAASAGLGVSVAVETHDTHRRAADVRRIVDQDGCSAALVIWDVLHSWLASESPADSMALLGERLAYVQVKDVVGATDLTPRPPATGALPLGEVAEAVRASGYDGWVSWEYERRWHPDAPPMAESAAGVRTWMRTELAAGA